MIAAAHRVLLEVFRRLPVRARRGIVRVLTPTYTAGSICVIERADGRIALIRQRYRNRWGLPGGLMARGESPEEAARREVREEIGLDVELVEGPVVVVEPHARRIDIVFRARPLAADDELDTVTPRSPEITAVGWFELGELPEVQDETSTALGRLGFAAVPDR